MSVVVTAQTDWWEEADIRYRLICGSLIFATFSAIGMGGQLIRVTAYTQVYTVDISLPRANVASQYVR